MICKQIPVIDISGRECFDLIRHYSDKGMYILQKETGLEFEDAVDTLPCKYTYEETDKPIEQVEDTTSENELEVENPEVLTETEN